MNISDLISDLQHILSEHGDLPLIDSHQLTNIREAAFRGKSEPYAQSVDVRPVNIHRDAEAETEEADSHWKEANEHADCCREEMKDLIESFDPDEYDTDEERQQALEEIADAGRDVAIAEKEEAEAGNELERVENLDETMTHFIIDC